MIEEELTAEQYAAVQAAQTVFANVANNVSGVLAADMSVSATQITLTPGGGALFPNAPFYCSIEFEVMWCLSKSGDSLVVQRGIDGTAAAAHLTGKFVEMRNNAGLWKDLQGAVNGIQAGVADGSILPADLVYLDKVQELTHKTIDLSDPSKANVIIGTVQPDPKALSNPNLLTNPGFDLWTFTPQTTLAAGTPTSGNRSTIAFCNFWGAFTQNDSSITLQRDTTHPDPMSPSGNNVLINVTTVQANDVSQIFQIIDSTMSVNYNALSGAAVSGSVRANLLSGNVSISFMFLYVDRAGAAHITSQSPFVPMVNGYSTYLDENVVWVPQGADVGDIRFYVSFKGVGQIALDNAQVVINPVATRFVQQFPIVPSRAANLLNNPSFRLNQRGQNTFNANQKMCDGWQLYVGPGGTITVNFGPISTPEGKSGSAGINNTVVGTGGNAIYQDIRTSEQPDLIGRLVSASCWFNSNVALPSGQVVLYVFSDGTNAVQTASAQQIVNGWNKLTVSAGPIPSDATYVRVQLSMAAVITAAWAAQFSLVIGSQPPLYVPMTPADELTRAQRYLALLVNGAASPGVCLSGSQANCRLPRPPQMGGFPTLTFAGGLGNFLLRKWDQTTVAITAVPGATGAWDYAGVEVQPNTAAGQLTAGYGCHLWINSAANFITEEWAPT